MHNGAHAGRRKVRLDMLMMIPAERRHAIATPDPELTQGRRQAACTSDDVGVRQSPHTAIGQPARDDLTAVERFGVSHDQRHRERHVHHQALHRRFPPLGQRRACTAVRRVARAERLPYLASLSRSNDAELIQYRSPVG